MYCSKCGNEIPDNCKFCSKCGIEINSEIQNSKKSIPFDFNKIIKNKKYMTIAAAVIIAVILIIVIISSLGSGGVSKKQICNDISFYAGFDDYDLDIVEYDEEKRDTNKESKYDQIWVNVVAENDDIRFIGSYMIMYKLYNDGWTYEYVEAISSDYSALKELDEERIKEDLLSEYNDLVTVYRLEDINIDMTLPLDTTALKTIDLRCICTAKNDEMTVEAVINVTYELKMEFEFCGWQLTECEMSNYSYVATTEPSSELLSKITSKWEKGYTLIDTKKAGNNEYTYKYNRTDKSTFKGITVEWDTVVTYVFTPENGWILSDSSDELKNAVISAKGTWSHKDEDGDGCTIKVNSVNNNKINFDVDITWTQSHWFSGGTQTFSEKSKEMSWKYTYNDVGRITFTTDENITELGNSLSSFSPKLEYVAYANEEDGTSGYVVYYWDLQEK